MERFKSVEHARLQLNSHNGESVLLSRCSCLWTLLSLPIFLVLFATALHAESFPTASAKGVLAESLHAIVYPVSYPRISSRYGPRKHPIRKVRRHHAGLDLAAPTGAHVLSVTKGKVVFADSYAGYGNLVVLEHKPGVTTHYGHLSKILVQPGEEVRAGHVIGQVGSTGLSSGPHLHFEIRKNGKPLNPETVLPGITEKPKG